MRGALIHAPSRLCDELRIAEILMQRLVVRAYDPYTTDTCQGNNMRIVRLTQSTVCDLLFVRLYHGIRNPRAHLRVGGGLEPYQKQGFKGAVDPGQPEV